MQQYAPIFGGCGLNIPVPALSIATKLLKNGYGVS